MALRRPNPRRSVVLGLSLALAFACKARQPGTTERALAAVVKRQLTVGGAGDHNPLPATEENVRRGRRAFSSYYGAR
ncbi:MAG TPA: hypothetical protein VEM76_17185 [Anaeromyxobacteraceae bacterium]|nr:hypothetical protein [Anaeromyxobacteraceae bacterium]